MNPDRGELTPITVQYHAGNRWKGHHMTGRGAWTKRGMPANGSQYYQFVTPVNVGAQPQLDQDHRAVNYGVKAIQTRINEMGFANPNNPPLAVTGILDTRTSWGIGWAQGQAHVNVDGQAGPITCKAILWPVINGMTLFSTRVRHAVGGICQHESGYDPGAVGYQDPDDLGLVQINGPANPNMSEADRFDYHKAFTYAANRINEAITTPGYTERAAIASYGYPSVAAYWAKNHTETFPQNPGLNQLALDYVAFITNWHAPA